MTVPTRAAVWLDHHEARIFHVDLEGFDEQRLRAPQHHFHRHPKGPTEPHEHPKDEERFVHEIAQALASASEVLVLGPSTAKSQFLKDLEAHARLLSEKIAAVETTDHPTDAQIVAHVRAHFHVAAPRVR